jgi:hypothetical protein
MYNQTAAGQHVRVGNWFEELKLKEDTGIRYFAPQQDRTKSYLTKDRCITHTERLEPKDYKSTTHETIIPPQSRPEYEWSKRKVGPRQQLLQEKLTAMVEAEYNERLIQSTIEANKVDFITESKSKFAREGFQSKGPKLEGSQRLLKAAMTRDDPITIYSHAVKFKGKIDFPSTFVASASNPFAKNAGFTSNYGESFEKPRHLPTVSDYQNLITFRKRLLAHVQAVANNLPGQSIREVLGCFWRKASNDLADAMFSNDMVSILQNEFRFNVLENEIKSIVSAFGTDDDEGLISLPDISKFLRSSLSGRRLNLVAYVYDFLKDDTDDRQISLSAMKLRYNGQISSLVNDLKSIHEAMGNTEDSLNVDDFFDYYTDISAECDSDDIFEDLISSAWKLV